jgi:hypothetical protein
MAKKDNKPSPKSCKHEAYTLVRRGDRMVGNCTTCEAPLSYPVPRVR